jgi:hypothetical protein
MRIFKLAQAITAVDALGTSTDVKLWIETNARAIDQDIGFHRSATGKICDGAKFVHGIYMPRTCLQSNVCTFVLHV